MPISLPIFLLNKGPLDCHLDVLVFMPISLPKFLLNKGWA
jgi:hypothetical protein